MTIPCFQLDVLKNGDSCVFCLSWGDGERRFATVSYPGPLLESYKDWQRTYLQFYRSRRGRVEAIGSGNTVIQTLDSRLEEKRAALMDQFNTWLRDGALTEIRETIAQAARPAKKGGQHGTAVDILVACAPLELARLPWEQWSLIAPTEQGIYPFRLLRTRLNSGNAQSPQFLQKRQKVRILVIIGEDEGGKINFRHDFEVLQKQLAQVAYLHPVGWTLGQDVISLKKQIAAAIADPMGWDVLFFAGHSNETKLTGGELAIAPSVSLHLNEIQPELEAAIQRGLQFAFFNSCSGLNIADALIDLGLNQVAVMREPIANSVAQKLLVKFLEHLAQYQDVQDALQSACLYLKSSAERFDYPSSYLVPSLYCQPQATLFRIQRKGWRRVWELWRPTLPEAIALGSLSCLCLLYPVQDFLLEQRLLLQSVYRNVTGQVQLNQKPPVLLVAIDQESIDQAKLPAGRVKPMSRSYLAELLDKATAFQPNVIGVDYFLKGPTQPEEDAALAKSIRKAVEQNQQWITFAARKAPGKGEITATAELFNLNWVFQGHVRFYQWNAELPSADKGCIQSCPFGYVLALTYAMKAADPLSLSAPLPQPNIHSQSNLRTQLFQYLQQFPSRDGRLIFIQQAQLPPITEASKVLNKSYKYIDQRWLQPIIDFSIPPAQAYKRISAKDFLDSGFSSANNSRIAQQVILIAPGGYEEAGIKNNNADNFSVSAAINYWREQQRLDLNAPENQYFTGGEFHAYMIHHLLSRRLVVPIPDLWMVLIAAFVGKAIALQLSSKPIEKQHHLLKLVGLSSFAYGLLSIQLYLLYPVLFPWVLPSIMFWFYLTPTFRRQFHA